MTELELLDQLVLIAMQSREESTKRLLNDLIMERWGKDGQH